MHLWGKEPLSFKGILVISFERHSLKLSQTHGCFLLRIYYPLTLDTEWIFQCSKYFDVCYPVQASWGLRLDVWPTLGHILHACLLGRVWLFATAWTIAHQAPLSIEFSRQEYWSGLPCPPPGDLPDPGVKHVSLMSPALAGAFFTTGTTWEALTV